MGEQAPEGLGFSSPAATDVEAEDDEAAAPVEFGVGVPAFAARGVADSRAGACVSARVRPSVAGDWADQSGVDRPLGAVPRRQAIAHDLNATGIPDRHVEVRRCGRHGFRPPGRPAQWLVPRATRGRPEHRTLHRQPGGHGAHQAFHGKNNCAERAGEASAAGEAAKLGTGAAGR